MKNKYYFLVFSALVLFIQTPSYLVNSILFSIAMVPLAILLGELTSKISESIGEKKGGLLAATIGNIPELMMGIWSIRYGMIPMVKSALIGSIISNMLLVLGVAVFFGGLKYKEQKFNMIVARTNFNMLFFAMVTMIVIASLNKYSVLTRSDSISISLRVAFVLIFIYMLGLVFSLYTHRNLFIVSEEKEEGVVQNQKKYTKLLFVIVLISVLLYFISEKLIFNLKEMVTVYDASETFLGIILIPLIGNIGENISAIFCAIENKVNLSLEIAIGSSIQIALFVTPLLIIFSYFSVGGMTFIFGAFQIIITAISIGMSYLVFQDGKTYWFEGAILLAIYTMLILAYYYTP